MRGTEIDSARRRAHSLRVPSSRRATCPPLLSGNPARSRSPLTRSAKDWNQSRRPGSLVAEDQPVVLGGDERLLAPPLGAEGDPGVGRRRVAQVPLGPAEDAPHQRVVEPGHEGRDHLGVEPAVEQAWTPSRPAAPGIRTGSLARGEPLHLPEHRHRALGGPEQVGGGEDRVDRPVADHGEVVDPGVEQAQPGLVDRRGRLHRLQRAGEHRGHRRRRAQAIGQHPVAEVPVGHDPGRHGAHQYRRDALPRHHLGCFTYRRSLLDPDGGAPDERAHLHREVGLERDRRRLAEARLESIGEPGGEVRREAGVLHQQAKLDRWNPVREEVLLDADVEGGLPGEERGVPEALPLLQHLERLAAALEPDHPLADHPEVLEGRASHPHEPGSLGEEADLEPLRRLVEEGFRQVVEGRRRPQEGDRVDPGHCTPR